MNIRDGQQVTLSENLDNKERRVSVILDLHHKHPNKSILCFKLNIPGPIKNNNAIQFIFDVGLKSLDIFPMFSQIEMDRVTGPEGFFVVDQSKENLKQLCVEIEETHPLGRLFDFDVFNISRKDLDLPERKCLICHKPAKECARSQEHSLTQLQNVIQQLMREYM